MNIKNLLYTFYIAVLGIISFFTKEVVTFIMLGFILIALQNINTTLKELLKTQNNKQ